MTTELVIPHAWPRWSPLLGVILVACSLASVHYHLATSQLPPTELAYLPDPPKSCSYTEPCDFSPLIDAPTPNSVRWNLPQLPKSHTNEEPLLPLGWEGITDPIDRRFLALVLRITPAPDWSMVYVSNDGSMVITRPKEQAQIVTYYERLLQFAWNAELDRYRAEVLASNRELALQWRQDVADYEARVWNAAWPRLWEWLAFGTLAAAAAVASRRWRKVAVVLGCDGLRVGGRLLAWHEIDEVDWYPSRVEVRLFDGTRLICSRLSLPDDRVRSVEQTTEVLRSRHTLAVVGQR